MAFDIRLPVINAQTERGQLEQMRSYLYQFAEQLKYAVDIIDGNTMTMSSQVKSVVGAVETPTDEQKQKQFANLKNLIISSADIVNSYTEKVEYALTGKYEALSSDFGEYWAETRKTVVETAENLTEYYDKLESIDAWKQNTSAYIRTGYLYDDTNGVPIYGVEVGQATVDENGNPKYEGMSRFTPTKTSFYDAYGNEMATLSNQELVINGIVCRGAFYIGNFMIDTLHGFSIRPSGRQVI